MPFNCPKCSAEIDAVPQDRFDTIYQERGALKTELNQARQGEEAALASANSAEELKAELAESRARLEATKDGHARVMHCTRAGISDADDVADLLAVFDRRAPEGVDLAAWLDNRAELPRAAAALLPSLEVTMTKPTATAAPAPEAPSAEPAPAPQGTPPPPTNNGAVTFSDSPKAWTAATIAQADYKQNRAAIRRAAGLPPKG